MHTGPAIDNVSPVPFTHLEAQSLVAAAEDMLIDTSGDMVVTDLKALMLEANRDLVSLIAANRVLQDTIIDLQNQVAKLCAHNATTTALIEAINIHLTA